MDGWRLWIVYKLLGFDLALLVDANVSIPCWSAVASSYLSC